MNKRIIYLFALLCAALFGVGCSEQVSLADGSDGTGTLRMQITATRAETAEYDPLDHLRVRIYNHKDELVRKYTSVDEATAELQLLAGEYRVSIEAGETDKTPLKGAASFTRRMYKGEKRFTVTAGQQTQVEVVCNLLSTAVEVVFDKSVTKHLAEGFDVRVAADAAFDEEHVLSGAVPALQYFESATGYFDLLESQTTLAWRFRGEHPERGVVEKTGLVPDIKQPGKYTLTFTYSNDLPGFVDCVGIRVDTSTDDQDDTIVFSPDPTVEGDGFDITQTQKYVSGEKRFNIATVKEMTSATLTFGEKHVDLMALAAQTPVSRADASPAEGVAAELLDPKTMAVTLSDAFFAGSLGGDHALTFHVADAKGGEATTAATFRLQGIVPVTASDYDLWSNTVTLRAVRFGPETPITFSLRKADGEWQQAEGTADGDGVYSASFSASWQEGVNEAGLVVYAPIPGTGVFANTSYECRAELGTETWETTFSTTTDQSIPDGDMENGGLSCFSVNNATTDFWGSGNNDYMSGIIGDSLSKLCTQQEKSGSKCALLATQKAAGMMAAGNLFSGTFVKPSTQGTVGFGKDYDWKARPKAMRLKYHATLGNVNSTKYKDESGNDPIASGQPDNAIIYVAIVDWDAPHGVSSGMAAPSGMWDPSTATSQSEGPIIGYGRFLITESTEGEDLVVKDLDIYYYDTTAKPSKACKIVISCSANAYGDYMNGCDSNRLYVDDFEWVY